jgi:hypothetical protein
MNGEEKNRGAGHRMTWVGYYYAWRAIRQAMSPRDGDRLK